MAVAFFSTDLMFSSRVVEAAKQNDLPATVVSSLQTEWSSQIDPDIRLVVVDLTMPELEIADVVQSLRKLPQSPRIVAFGPHVASGKLDAARSAGCDRVLTRNQFSRELETMLASIAGA